MNNESGVTGRKPSIRDSLLCGRLCVLQLLIVQLPKKNGRFFIEFPRHFVLIKLDLGSGQISVRDARDD